MEEKQKKMLGYIFAGIIVVGLVLAIVGMFLGAVTAEVMNKSESIGLFDEGWDLVSEVASPTFAIIAFIVTIVGGVVLVVNSVLKILGKEVKFLGLIGGALTLIGAILILVAGLMLAGDMNEATPAIDPYSAGIGIWLGFIGGLLAGAAGIVGSLKAFN